MRSLGQNPTEQDVKDLVEEKDINGKKRCCQIFSMSTGFHILDQISP